MPTGRTWWPACAFDELTADNVWNRVLKKAIRVTRPWIRGVELHRRWVELMGVLDEVDDSRLTGAEVGRLTFDRRAERYRGAIDWARWILALLSPALRAGCNEAPALLFDMNRLFESAVASVARREARGVQVELAAQDTSRSLAMHVSAERVEAAFTLRPDLVFRQGGTVVAVADTKWKLPLPDRLQRLVPSETDMYQMHAYAAAFRCAELALVYPWSHGMAATVETRFRLPHFDGPPVHVTVLCIDVHDDALPLRLGQWPFAGRVLTEGVSRVAPT